MDPHQKLALVVIAVSTATLVVCFSLLFAAAA